MDVEIKKKLDEILEASRILHEKTDAEIAENKKRSDAEIAVIRKQAEKHKEESEALKKQTDAEIAEMRKESELLKKQTDAEIAENKKRTDAEIAEIRKKAAYDFKKISQHLGSYTENVANISEEYFYQSLKGSKQLAGMHFDDITKNFKRGGKEYDIVLENGKNVVLVSVKTTIYSHHIKSLIKKDLPTLKTHFKDKRLFGVIAGLTYKGKVEERACDEGILMLTLSDQNKVTTVNPDIALSTF